MRKICEETGNQRLRFYLADFASLAQVREMAGWSSESSRSTSGSTSSHNAGIGTVDGGNA